LFENSENYLRDFIPVEQVIEIQTKFFSKEISGVWNVGTGNPRSFRSIAEQIASRTGATIKYIPMPNNLKTQYQSYTCANLELLRSVIE
jgi:ADP-L-glycero-D-manno-heptose 6-epimerase